MVTDKNLEQFDGALLVCFAAKAAEEMPDCDPVVADEVQKAYDLGDFSGKSGEAILVYPPIDKTGSGVSAKRLLILGLGRMESDQKEDECCEAYRRAGGEIAKCCGKFKAGRIMVSLSNLGRLKPAQLSQSLAEGILLGDYRFKKYKNKPEKENAYDGLKSVKFFTKNSVPAVRKGAKLGFNAAQAACEARDMANEPGNGWTAREFAGYGKQLAKSHGFTCTILDKKKMEKLGMGGLLAVNQGSKEPPCLVILEYSPGKVSETLLLVGKGITFDSGGISLKPAPGMEAMKYDMCGGAAVLSLMKAVGEEKPNLNVVAMVPATDNMSGSAAVRPGDIIRHYNGVTSEIVNTDAEGRVVLGDALAYGIEKFKPDCVVDLATLTGAAIIGLGHHHSGLLSNNDPLVARLETAGKMAGEPLWRLPLTREYAKQIESKVADIKNVGGKAAGTITAAAYLENFVGDTPWAHLDIAGTAWDFTEKSYIPKGPSGIGVRTLLELIRNWKTGGLN